MSAATTRRQEKLHLETLEEGGLTWLHMEKPAPADTEYLGEHFQFHPLNLEDVLSRITRPKIDEYDNHLFIVLHFPVYDKENQVTTASEMDVFIGEDYLVTIDCSGNLKALDKFFNMCQTEAKIRQENFGQGTAYLLYRILDRLVDYCFPMLNKIADNAEEVEDRIFSSDPRGSVRGISILRRDIISFRRTVWPVRAVIGSLEPRVRRFTKMDMKAYFGDLVDHLDRIWDGLSEYKEIIEGLNDTHDSLASNRINDVLRVLTILTTIATTLAVVVGFYGMNIQLPFGSTAGGNPLSWVFLLLAMVTIASVMLFYFYRKHWL
jgi:magnesium transporter